jgi:hypothetical protein
MDQIRRVSGARVRGVRLSSAVLLGAVVVTAIGANLPWIYGYTKYSGFVNWTGMDDWADGFLLIVLSLVYLAYVRFRHSLVETERHAAWLPLLIALVSLGILFIDVERVLSLTYVGPDNGARPQVGLAVSVVGGVVGLIGALLVASEDRRPAPRKASRTNPDAVPTQRVR